MIDPQHDLDHIKAHIEGLPTKDLADLRDWLAMVLQNRWWVQHGANPAVLRVLEATGGCRAETYTLLTRPTPHLGGAAPITVVQTPEGLRKVLGMLDRLGHGPSS